jgi:NAD(P)-dependent dehydrogenase (short-subunit alcohol dehydrogenase family)
MNLQRISNYQASPGLLKERIILVTGAGDGIGQAAAKTFAAHGATVILLGKTIPKLERTYDEIVDAGGPQPAIIPLDLEGASYDDYLQVADSIEKEFGRLDGLLHNAGILGALTPIQQYDLKMWAQVLQVNLTAPFLLTRALLPLLKKSTDARILFTSSGVAHQGCAYWGAYGVSKAGQDNLMGVLADELESNTSIRVNSIDPGRVRTRMRALAYPGEEPTMNPAPEEIMTTYLYLMGPDSKEVTGQLYQV